MRTAMRGRMLFAIGGLILTLAAGFAIAIPESLADKMEESPLIAIWCKSLGHGPSEAPYLRVAIWEDGYALFAGDSSEWGHSLREGRIAEYRIGLLKEALVDTGVFEQEGTTYLVPSGSVYCISLNVNGRRKTLYWDEIESPRHGININPKPRHIAFKKCWTAVNNLALVACPDSHTKAKGQFQRPPRAWYADKAVQSN